MKELATLSINELADRIIGLPYAFAAWKKPDSLERNFIVSLDQIRSSGTPISQLSTGFVINRFADNHPIRPFHINADLIFKDEEVKIGAHISSDQVDRFKEDLSKLQKPSLSSRKKVPSSSHDFAQLVDKAIHCIAEGAMEKVVLARFEDKELPSGFSIPDFYDRLCDKYPNAFVSMVQLPGEGIWIGASPELLLSDNGQEFKTIALAGTKSLMPNQLLTEIAWTQKEIEEQALVSRYIINCFKKLRLREFDEKGPKTAQAGNLVHLKTEFVVDYQALNFDQLADQMLELLHPTSAVCGMPLDASKQFIKENESFDRSFYAGFLGPVNFDGSTNLFVNLRCAHISKNTIRFFAGAGITEDSIPEHEMKETTLKMAVLKQLLN